MLSPAYDRSQWSDGLPCVNMPSDAAGIRPNPNDASPTPAGAPPDSFQILSEFGHGINNLLQIMNGHCDCILDNIHDPCETEERVRRIQKTLRRAAALSANAMESTHRKRSDDVIDVNAILRQSLRQIEAIGHSQVETTLARTTHPTLIRGNRQDVEQVFLNLLLNACQAATNEGTVIVRSELLDERRRPIADDAPARQAHYFRITVADNGPGIPPELIPHIFTPFFTTKPQGQGTGLGLAIVARIVQALSGEISAANRDEGGAEFRVLLLLDSRAPATDPGRARECS